MGTKVLVSGDVKGNFDSFFKRVNLILAKKGAFDSLFCIGDFFDGVQLSSWNTFIESNPKILCPTFILLSNQKDFFSKYAVSKELYPNLHILGKSGVYTTSSGIRIAYLSNDGANYSSKDKPVIDSDVEKVVLSGQTEPIDILLSSHWPLGVTKCDSSDNSTYDEIGNLTVSYVAFKLKPRYHFSANENIFYSRKPYRNHIVLAEKPRHPTYFIALSSISSKTPTSKWLYAFTIDPVTSSIPKDGAAGSTANPYEEFFSLQNDTVTDLGDSVSNQYFFDSKYIDSHGTCASEKRQDSSTSKNPSKKKAHPKVLSQSECWFCLSNESVEAHLCVHIDEIVYVALAKGSLCPHHILVIPVEHVGSIGKASYTLIESIDSLKQKILVAFKERLNSGVIFYERNFHSQHMHIQAIPVPIGLSSEKIKASFLSCAESNNITLFEVPCTTSLKQASKDSSYFFVEINDKCKLYCSITKSFPISFGREVLCLPSLLNLADKVDWKNCILSKAEEECQALKTRNLLQSYFA